MGKGLKTHKGVKARFKVTGTGKLMHFRSGRRHLMTGKPSRKTRVMRRSLQIAKVQERMLKRLMPHR